MLQAPFWPLKKNSGNTNIFTYNLSTKRFTRITDHYGIDTEPDWLPDSSALVFTSSRSGGPQIFRRSVAGGSVKRLTYEGDYNARAKVLPDGKGMVMVHKRGGIYHIALQSFLGEAVDILTSTEMDESPSVAPNGRMLIYATQRNRRGVLAAVSVEGREIFFPASNGDVREPAWSPFMPSKF